MDKMVEEEKPANKSKNKLKIKRTRKIKKNKLNINILNKSVTSLTRSYKTGSVYRSG